MLLRKKSRRRNMERRKVVARIYLMPERNIVGCGFCHNAERNLVTHIRRSLAYICTLESCSKFLGRVAPVTLVIGNKGGQGTYKEASATVTVECSLPSDTSPTPPPTDKPPSGPVIAVVKDA